MKKHKNARLLLSTLAAIISAAIFYVALVSFTGSTQHIFLLAGGTNRDDLRAVAAAAVTQDVVHPGFARFCRLVRHRAEPLELP